MSRLFKYSGRLWQAFAHGQDQDAFLTVDARQVIGILYSVDNPSFELIVKATRIPEELARPLFDQIRLSDNFVIRYAITNGLSLASIVNLPIEGAKIKCKRCRNLLSAVSCLSCSMKNTNQITTEPIVYEFDLPQDKKPTNAMPGSREKLAVMQERARRGLSVFCDRDGRPHDELSTLAIRPERRTRHGRRKRLSPTGTL
jgi:hypothetical protein